MVDLLFMERIARWLTNTQVKIKAEVADSNSQAQRLAQHLEDLERKIDACERPNLDKEVCILMLFVVISQQPHTCCPEASCHGVVLCLLVITLLNNNCTICDGILTLTLSIHSFSFKLPAELQN